MSTTIEIGEKLTPEQLVRLAPMIRDADAARLCAKIVGGPNGCWEWQGARMPEGYGRIGWRGKACMAHRVIYEIVVDHLCRNPPCVNPAHMEPVPLRANILRGGGVGVRNAAKTHCRNGHEFTEANTYRSQGKRKCRRCASDSTRRWERKTGRKA